jgi:hypothetical protein
MSVQIKQINHDVFEINGKSVTKDMEGNWIYHQELTPSEEKAFKAYLNSIS